MGPQYTVANADPANTWVQMLQGQQALDPTDPDIQELQLMTEATGGLPVMPTTSSKPWEKPQLSVSRKIKTGYQTPQQSANEQEMLNLVRQYGAASQSALGQQEEGVNTLGKRIGDMRAQGPGTNWRPLASFLDTMTGGNLAANVPSVATPEAYGEKMLGLESDLQKARQGLSKEKADALKEQIAAYKASKDSSLDEELKTAKIGFYNQRPALQANQQMFQAHKDVLNKIKTDKQVTARLAQMQNLQNAMDIINKADIVTPQQIHEFQQAVRNNIGLKGSSGVSERDETYIKSLGMNVANVKQFLTGTPQDVSNNPALIKHLKDLVRIEQANISKQADRRINSLAGGWGHLYKNNPAYKAELDAAIQGSTDQFDQGAPNALEVGHEEGGYKYIGGPTGEPASWEKIK